MAIEQSTLSLISAVGGLVAAIGGLVAAAAAFRSAGTARDAANRAQQTERRALLRDVLMAAHNVIAETMRVDDLGNKLKGEYRSLAIFAGQLGGSREKLHTNMVEEKQRGLQPLQQEALKTIEDQASWKDLPEDELTNLLTRLSSHLIQIRRVKEKFLQDLNSVEGENRTYRESAMKGDGGQNP